MWPSLNLLSKSVADFRNISPEDVERATKHKKRHQLISLLRRLGHCVTFSAHGNKEILKSSGFTLEPISKEQSLPKPNKLIVISSGKGKVEISLDNVEGAYRYRYEYRTIDSGIWDVVLHKKNRVLITGLKRNLEYEFRVLPIDSHGLGEYSEVIKLNS